MLPLYIAFISHSKRYFHREHKPLKNSSRVLLLLERRNSFTKSCSSTFTRLNKKNPLARRTRWSPHLLSTRTFAIYLRLLFLNGAWSLTKTVDRCEFVNTFLPASIRVSSCHVSAKRFNLRLCHRFFGRYRTICLRFFGRYRTICLRSGEKLVPSAIGIPRRLRRSASLTRRFTTSRSIALDFEQVYG